MKKFICIILVICLLLSFTSCDGIKKILGRGAEQTFSYPIEQMPETLDPQVASSSSELTIIENCMEGLIRINSKGEAVPAVAQSWSVSADGLKYVFKLRQDAVWYIDEDFEDFTGANFNKKITAKDFVFAISRAVKKSTQATDFQSVSLIKNAVKIHDSGKENTSSLGVKALDDYTLQITLETPNSAFLYSLANAVFMPCSEQFFNLCSGRYGRQLKYFVSNAGFYLSSWVEKSLTIRNNDTYRGTNAAKGESVSFYFDENAFESFKNDNYDAIPIGEDYIGEVLADENLSVQKYDDTVWSLAVNCKSSFGGSKAFRQALMQSFESDKLTYPDWVSPAQGIVPNICTAGEENYRKQAGSANILKCNPSAASAKYQSVIKRLSDEDEDFEGSSVSVYTIAAFEDSAKHIVQSWQQNLGTGFEAKINVVTFDELAKTVESGEYDIAIYPFSADTMDALVFLNKFATKDNVLNFGSRDYMRALSSKKAELSKCLACENILISSGVLRPLFTSNSYYAQRKNVSGIYFYAFGGKVNFINAVRAE